METLAVRGRYRATVEGLGYFWGWMGKLERMLLLREVVAEDDGRVVAAATVFRLGKNLMQLLPLAEGDVIGFDARLMDRVEDEYPYVALTRVLRQPTRAEVLSRRIQS